jgi:hypothetical protein
MVNRLLAFLFLLPADLALAQPVAPEALRRHIDVLASDSFEGREPGTEGERKTIAYITGEWKAAGLEPAGLDGSWLQHLELRVRTPVEHRSLWQGKKKRDRAEFGADSLLLVGRSEHETIERAPVVFIGPRAALPDGDRLRGAVVIAPYQAPEGLPDFAARSREYARHGAAAVIAVFGTQPAWDVIRRPLGRRQARLAIDEPAPIQGGISWQGAERLLALGRSSVAKTMGDETAFVPLGLRATLDASTRIETIRTANVLGRIRGSGSTGESLLYLGHWDHLGICRPAGEPDRICNGAVDNASGIASLIEIARALAKGPPPKRDIFFLATTSEEKGLLGAEYFAARPPVPLRSIVAAVNLDTVAIAPRGEKVAVMGRGVAALDAVIDKTVADAGRTLDTDDEAAAFVRRQDGWALARAGVPAIMVGGSFSDMKKLMAFLSGPYHSPGDNPGRDLVLGGAAEDAELMIALGRNLADPAVYRTR